MKFKFALFLLPILVFNQKPIDVYGATLSRGNTTALSRALQEISRDSLEALVSFLSRDPVTSELRSRFTFRENELSVMADSLAARLERYTGETADRLQFTAEGGIYDEDSTFVAENIVARLIGTGEASGVVLVTAHYDAIGLRTEGWTENWQVWPAPGANDNATGVAAVMEGARILAASDLPFDILFVLFSAEELGWLGSIDFVERYDALYGEEILGVLNVDMIGYPTTGNPGGTVMSDYRSGWIADMVEENRERIDPDFPILVLKPGPVIADHTPFWNQQIPAITLSEVMGEDGSIIYPYYHTVRDTFGFVDFEQVERMTKLLVGTLARFSDASPEVALYPSDILFYLRGNWLTGRRRFEIGDSLSVTVGVRNIGSTAQPSGSSLSLTVTLENRSGIQILYAGGIPWPDLLQAEVTEIVLTLDGGFAGQNRINATLSVDGFEEEPGNNSVVESFIVEGGVEVLIGHTFQPNPIQTSFADASFCINLASEANLILELYTLEGECMGTAHIGPGYGNPLNTGLNCLRCSTIFPHVGNVASGVYLYRIKLFRNDGRTEHVAGRFAVTR